MLGTRGPRHLEVPPQSIPGDDLPVRRSAILSPIDTRDGSPKGYYVHLGMPAINRDSMAQHVCGGRAATRYPQWTARAGEHQSPRP